MFKAKDKPDPMAVAAASFAERAAAVACLDDTADRYASALRLRYEIDRYLRDRQREFGALQDKRMTRTILGIGASVPLGIGAAVALGTPLGILLVGPAMMGLSAYSSGRHRRDSAVFAERMALHGANIVNTRTDIVRELDDIVTHRLELLARSPKAQELVRKSPPLREAFMQRGMRVDPANDNPARRDKKNGNGFSL